MMTEENVLSLDEIIAMGNEGAPQEWLDNFTGQGIGNGYEGVHGQELDDIMANLPEDEQVTEATYEIKFNQCHGSNYTPGRQGVKVDYIVVHYTAGAQTAEGAAQANTIYFSGANRGASAHYFIDDGYTIWQSVKETDTAWHAGNWNMNLRAIGIEVCSAGVFTAKEIERLTWLVQTLMKRYNIPASRVIRHYDVTGKLCPAYYVDANRWSTLHKMITTGSTSTSTFRAVGTHLHTPNNTNAQKFIAEFDTSGEWFKLKNIASGLYLDVKDGGTTGKVKGTPVRVCTGNSSSAQLWKLVKYTASNYKSGTVPVKLVPKCAQDLCLDCKDGNEKTGAGLQLWTPNNTEAQKFVVIDHGADKIWSFINTKGMMAVDVDNGGK